MTWGKCDGFVRDKTGIARQSVRWLCLVCVAGCSLTVKAIGAESPPPRVEEAPAKVPPTALPTEPGNASPDSPPLILDQPALPTGGKIPRTNKFNPLLDSLKNSEAREVPVSTNPGLLIEDSPITLRIPSQTLVELPQSDPVSRAALFNALTNAESLVDGLSGIPSPFASAFPILDSPATGRVLKVGPLAVQVGVDAGFFFDHTKSSGTDRNTLDAQMGSRQNAGDSFSPTFGARFNIVLGTPATGNTLGVVYGVEYVERGGNTAKTSNGQNGDDQPFNQQLSMLGSLTFTKLKLGLGVSYDSLSGANRDFGGAVDRQLLTISLTSSYAMTSKTSLNWDIALPIRQISGGIDSSALTSTIFINHMRSPKLEIGVGIEVGTEGRTNLETQTFEQGFLRLTYNYSPRLILFGTFGIEERTAGDSQSINPLGSLGVEWRIREGTVVRVSAARTVQSSGSTSDANYASTSAIVGVSQRLGSRVTVNLSAGFEDATYQSINANDSVTRSDRLFTGQLSLLMSLGRNWSASFSYVYSENRSATAGFESSRGQFQATYRF